MKLSELILQVGDENIIFQNLNNDMSGCECLKNEGRITFSTDKSKVKDLMAVNITGGETEYLGLVLWLPRKRIQTNPSSTPAVSSDVPNPSSSSTNIKD